MCVQLITTLPQNAHLLASSSVILPLLMPDSLLKLLNSHSTIAEEL